MDIQVSGYDNSRPWLWTYRLSEESLAEAVARSDTGSFDVMTELDTEPQYAIVDEAGEFYGLIMFWGDEWSKAMITTFLKRDWKPGEKFQIHCIEKLDKQLNY